MSALSKMRKQVTLQDPQMQQAVRQIVDAATAEATERTRRQTLTEAARLTCWKCRKADKPDASDTTQWREAEAMAGVWQHMGTQQTQGGKLRVLFHKCLAARLWEALCDRKEER